MNTEKAGKTSEKGKMQYALPFAIFTDYRKNTNENSLFVLTITKIRDIIRSIDGNKTKGSNAMKKEFLTMKEETILFAKEKIEDAMEALSEIFPDPAEELNWFLEELENQLQSVRSERLLQMNSALYGTGETA